MTLRLLALALILPLTACGDDARFLIASGPTETGVAASKARVGVRTIEVRDVSLPTYASASEIVVEQADGSLKPVKSAIWADDPVRGVTGALARALDARSTATVSAEPWPLLEPADVQVEVRIDRMVAKAVGGFELTGQYAIASSQGSARESVQRFTILTALQSDSAAAVAQSTGIAIEKLASEIVAKLRR